MNVWKQLLPPLVVSLVATFDDEGRVNASPKTWWSPTSYTPPQLILAVKPESDTHANIELTGRWVLHLPPGNRHDVATKVLHTAKKLPRGENELDDVGLSWSWQEHPDMEGWMWPVVDHMPFIACMATSKIEGGDHTVYEGQVVMAGVENDELGIETVLLHRGQNVFVDIGQEWKAERY